MSGSSLARKVALAAALAGPGCYDFHLTGPEDPPPVNPPQLVSVTVEYRQPNGCENSIGRCDDPVVFFASWMEPGNEFRLTRDAGGFIWRGTATRVPVNFPPRDHPHAVRVFDPHIYNGPSGGATAERLRVGTQVLTVFDSAGSPNEVGLLYVDGNGIGHNPF